MPAVADAVAADALPADLAAQLAAATGPGVILDGLADRLIWAGDASIYRLVPRLVAIPRHLADLQAILALAAKLRAPLCFRAGGTSLSGQAVTDGILVVVSRHFRRVRVLDGGARVSCQPGAVGAQVNAVLAPYGRRIGPDPASLQAAEIGGIVANNASGMCCGVAENSYRTLDRLDLILADGTRLDTGAADADIQLERARPDLVSGLMAIRDRIRADPALCARITRAFATKNTVGYSLNAFLDADTAAGILQRLVVGSEGTLAFIAEATFRTLPLARCRATAWLLFANVEDAGAAVAPLAGAGAAAIEVLDSVALARVAHKLPAPLPPGAPAALLVEYQQADEATLAARIAAAADLLAALPLLAPAAFTRDAEIQASYWAIRKGLFPSVGAVRAAGTAVVIEDVTFPVADLARGMRALRALFDAHGYADAVIFGHAKDGNLHFTLTPDFARPGERERYDRFMRALVDLVLAHGGHLKAEHGTGRNMAPFVARQWGADAVAHMRAVKALLDPHGLLNPGVLLNDDPDAHLRHLKTLPVVDGLVDRCIECGFCEPVCPSRDLTLTPRQRIAALRLRDGGTPAERAAIGAVWQHRAVDTCAADGMCATACPVAIDTGDLVKAERGRRQGPFARIAAAGAARHFAVAVVGARAALTFAHAFGVRHLPGTRIPLPPPARPFPGAWPQARGEDDGAPAPTVIYLATCIARATGPDDVPGALRRLARAAGIGVVVPERAHGACCGQPFASKGFPAAHRDIARRSAAPVLAAAALLPADAPLTLVTDTSTCAAQYARFAELLPPADAAAWARIRIRDPAGFAADELVPRLAGRLPGATGKVVRDVLHPTCSEMKNGWVAGLVAAAGAAGRATVPVGNGCCGMAGDKGWSVPELTAAATRAEGHAARDTGARTGICTSSLCGMAMGAASGVAYRHLWAVLAERLDEVHRPPR
jgi:D-lactate dehydrogenase